MSILSLLQLKAGTLILRFYLVVQLKQFQPYILKFAVKTSVFFAHLFPAPLAVIT